MTESLTRRQKEVLAALERYAAQAGYPPTLRELARILGIRGISAVKKHLDALATKGYLSRDRRARAIVVARRARAATVPILGRVAAGRPLLADENCDSFVALDRDAVRGGVHFLLRVQGESMLGNGILPNDYVLVRAQSQAEDGDVVVALLGDEATVKRLIRRAAAVELHSSNPAFAPIPIRRGDPFRILGKVVGLVRLPNLR